MGEKLAHRPTAGHPGTISCRRHLELSLWGDLDPVFDARYLTNLLCEGQYVGVWLQLLGRPLQHRTDSQGNVEVSPGYLRPQRDET